MTPPNDGANSGATPITSMSRDISREASAPTNRSRMIAMATTVADALKNPCTLRSAMSGTIAGAIAHSSDVRTCSTTPISTGLRRPNRSDSGPITSWPTAPPMSIAVMVSCAAVADVFRSRATSGSDGRYMSVETAGRAHISPSISTYLAFGRNCGAAAASGPCVVPGGTTLAAGAWPVGAEGRVRTLIERILPQKTNRFDSRRV